MTFILSRIDADALIVGVCIFLFSVIDVCRTCFFIYVPSSFIDTFPLVSCNFFSKKYVNIPCFFFLYGNAVSSPEQAENTIIFPLGIAALAFIATPLESASIILPSFEAPLKQASRNTVVCFADTLSGCLYNSSRL